MPVVVYSSKDQAGTNIANCLKDLETEIEVIKTDQEIIRCDTDITNIRTDFIVFASKHRSEKGVPAFTVHIPGNWNSNELGGDKSQISFSDPSRMKAIALALENERKKAGVEFGVFLEADHHGPLTRIPCAFVEVGSTENEWKNKKYGMIIANAIMRGLKTKPKLGEVVFGVGGGHYCPAFTKLELETETAIAHVLPGHHIDVIDFESFKQGIERSAQKVEKVLLDWKGMKGVQRQKAIQFTEQIGIGWAKV